MSLWLAVRRAGWCVVTTLGVVAVVAAIGGVVVPVPALGSFEDAAWPVSLVAPVAIAIVLAWALSSGEPRFEGIAVRPVVAMDLTFVVSLTGTTALAVLAVGMAGWTDLGAEVARNTFGYVGLMLIGRWLVGGEAAAAVPVAYIVLAAFFGGSSPPTAAWWAWLVRPANDPLSWTLTLGLFAAGVVLLVLPVRALLPARSAE